MWSSTICERVYYNTKTWLHWITLKPLEVYGCLWCHTKHDSGALLTMILSFILKNQLENVMHKLKYHLMPNPPPQMSNVHISKIKACDDLLESFLSRDTQRSHFEKHISHLSLFKWLPIHYLSFIHLVYSSHYLYNAYHSCIWFIQSSIPYNRGLSFMHLL